MVGVRYNDGYNLVPRDNAEIILWLFFSVLVHVALATLLVFSPKSSRKIVYSPVYEVDLVPAPVAPVLVKPEQPSPVQEEARPAPEPKQEKVSHKTHKNGKGIAMPKSTARKAARPEDAISTLREKFAADEAVDRIRRKMREKDGGGGSGTAGSAVRISQAAPARVYHYEELDAELRAYFDKVSRAVTDSWTLPEALRNKGYKAVLSIHVLRDGTIDSLWIEKGSGNRYYDESALRAINKINPLPPLPKVWKEGFIDLGLRL